MPQQRQNTSVDRGIDKSLDELIGSNSDLEQLLIGLADQLGDDLIETSPQEGVEGFIDEKRDEVLDHTAQEYREKLNRFIRFCDHQNIRDLRVLNGRIISEYRQWLRDESSNHVDSLSQKTMRDHLYLFREFIEYLERIEAVEDGLHTKIKIPKLSNGAGVRNVELASDRVERITSYLSKFLYATLVHVTWLLFVRTGRRTGGIVGLDLEDVHLEGDEPYIEFNSREETRLKNGAKGEGTIAISKEDAQVIQDYIDHHRPDVIDDASRRPLLASQYGRISKSAIRRYIYQYSRPCAIGQECPHDRDPDSCTAASSMDKASKCPSSRSPHALRHGFISAGRRRGIPIDVLADRCDVSPEVLRKVYDESTNQERLDIRRKIIEEVAQESGGGYL